MEILKVKKKNHEEPTIRQIGENFFKCSLIIYSSNIIIVSEKKNEDRKGKPICQGHVTNPQKSYKCNKCHPISNKWPRVTALSCSQKTGTC